MTSKPYYTMEDVDIEGKRVLVRLDVNSPLDPETGKFLDDSRVRLHLDTLRRLRGSRVTLLAHQSRPGKSDFTTLEEHAKVISDLLGRDVKYVDDLFGSHAKDEIRNLESGEFILLENTRLYGEEVGMKEGPCDIYKKTHIIKKLHPLFDYFINDAFATAHRAQPTVTGFCAVMPSAAGVLMDLEVSALSKVLEFKDKPRLAVLGGIKADDSLAICKNMLENNLADKVLTVGGVGQMFMMARGVNIGKPSTEVLMKEVENYVEHLGRAASLLSKYPDRILIPVDVAINDNNKRVPMKVTDLPSDKPIYDIGLETIAHFTKEISSARSVVLNGPAGVFELEEFTDGTEAILRAMAESEAFTVVGGGHTNAAAYNMGLTDRLDHVSSGGGACLSFLSGKPMPALQALIESKKRFPDPFSHPASS